MTEPAAQSDDCYERISFRRIADGSVAAGVAGWREGIENRVVFEVWDGPSAAAEGADVHDAFGKALARIRAQGFWPLVAGAGAAPVADAHALCDPADIPLTNEMTPRVEPMLWVALAVIVLAILWPLFARADEPAPDLAPACVLAPEIALTPPGSLPAFASSFVEEISLIAARRDLSAFFDLVADDVLVSFGGNGGHAEFRDYWRLDEEEGRAQFWRALDRLIGHPAQLDDDAPATLTFPWYFAAWPHDVDAWDILIARDGVMLRALPDDSAPVLAALPAYAVLRYLPSQDEIDGAEWMQGDWLAVATREHCSGYMRREEVSPLLGTRMIARQDAAGWKIEAFVSGD